MKRFVTAASFLVLASQFLASGVASADEYKVDASHSRIGFSVRHLVTRVNGEFKDYSGVFDFDPAKKAFGAAKLEVKATSIDTGTVKRDEHLRSADFFDVAKFPLLSATSGKITANGGDKFQWATELTLHGVTKPVTFELEYLGQAKDPWGGERLGFQAKAKINRKDFGLVWNKALETGGVLVGDDVEITLDIEAIKNSGKKS